MDVETILKLVVVVFVGIAVVGAIAMTLFNHQIRRKRVLYRVFYILFAICGLIGCPLMTYISYDEIELAGAITMNVLLLPFLVVVIIYNIHSIKVEWNEKPVISTLENCTVEKTMSADRVYMWIEGTSREGRKSKFEIEFPPDQAMVTSKEVTPDTIFIFEYYEYNDSIVSIKREN